jgi:phage gp29-like protein
MVEIVDHRGQPLKQREITEAQTAGVGQLPQTIGEHPSRGLTPSKLARVLEHAEAGDMSAQLDLAEDIEEKDGHTFAELSKRRRALLGLDWSIQPPRNATAAEERATETVRELVADIDIDAVILDMADAIAKAYSCLELTWERADGLWQPAEIAWRPQRWFQVGRQGTRGDVDEDLRLRDTSGDGAALQAFGWIAHVHKARSGHIARAGLSRVLAWPFLFKNYSVRDLAEFLEIYGLPLRLGKYPPGSSEREKATLLRAVTSIGHAAAGIVPEGMDIDFQEAAKGASDPFLAMIDWCERTQSKAILGATLTSQADRGSNTNALGSVHNEVRRDLLVSDARQIGATLTRDLLFPIAALNTAGIRSLRRAPRFVFDTREPADLEKYAKALPGLVRSGLQIPRDWAHEKLGIPEPADDQDVLELGPQPPRSAAARRVQGGHPSGCQCARCRGRVAAVASREAPTDTAEAQANQLEDEAGEALDGLIDRIRELVDEVDSLEALADRLLEAFPEMDASELADAMGQAFTAAAAAGRFDLTQDP